MSVYVDEAVWEWKGRLWCHLVADSLTELHAFARKLGLRPGWFQHASRYPHYDLTREMRNRAIDLGAIAADRHKLVAVTTKLRREKESTPRPMVQMPLL